MTLRNVAETKAVEDVKPERNAGSGQNHPLPDNEPACWCKIPSGYSKLEFQVAGMRKEANSADLL